MSPRGRPPRKVIRMSDLLDPYEPDDGPGGLPALQVFVIGALVGALLVGVAWLVVSLGSNSSGQPASPVAGGSISAGRSGNRSGPTPTVGCTGVFAAQTPVMQAAAASIGQWQVHTDEMNELVTGTTTLDRTLAAWDRARGAAQRLVDQFRTALEDYRARDARCPQAGLVSGVSPSPGTCASAVAARDDVVRSAARAVRTWSAHIDAMESLRLGTLSGDELARMWLDGWGTAVRQLNTYNTDVQLAQDATC